MTSSINLLRACAIATTVVTTPASSQTPAAPPKPVPTAPSVQTRSALKLAGLVTFVANSCPDLKPDYPRFEAALAALGVTTFDLAKPDMKAVYLAYTMRYGMDAKATCTRAKAQFGPGGTTLPDIFVTR